MMKVLVVPAVLAAFCVGAADFTLKTSVSGQAFDWRVGSNYEEETAPSAGDVVIIPKDVNAKLSHGDAWWDFVSALGRIRPTTATSFFTVSVPAGVTNSLSCEITNTGENSSKSWNKGGLVKTGGGGLSLVMDKYDYFTAITVNEGGLIVVLTQSKCSIDSLAVAEGAFVDVTGDKTFVMRKFSGAGEITSTDGSTLQTFSNDSLTSDFSGRFTGNLKLNSCSRVLLRNEASTKSGTVNILGVDYGAEESGALLGVAELGSKGDTFSSIGNLDVLYFGMSTSPSGGLLYLGDGGTSDKDFSIRTFNRGSFTFVDGGANGDLTLTGGLFIGNDNSALNHRFGLCGSNVADCVLGMTLTDYTDTNGNMVSYHVVKRGTGTWKLDPKPESTWAGALTVEEGTLKFDTLTDAGSFCSLGYATNLFECYTGVFDESRRVDWAIALGTSDTRGTLQYTGTDGAVCSSRPVLMRGDGRIVNDGAGRFSFKGITSDGADEKVLTLDGAGTADNIISGLDDSGGGAVSVLKQGNGRWMLSAHSSFRGDVDVREGTLGVMAPTNGYTWFRFTDMQVCTNRTGYEPSSPAKSFYMREIAFFNAEGVSQTIGLEYTDSRCDVLPGQFAWGKDMSVSYAGAHRPATLFDDTAGYAAFALPAAPVLNDEATWFPLVVRLPEGADRVTSFDLAWNTSASGAGALYHPSAFKIEGSVDGLEWTELFTTNGVVSPGSGYWLSDKKSYVAGTLTAARTDPEKRRYGIALEHPTFAAGPLDGVRTVSVAAGATLESVGGSLTISSFSIDMTSGGGTVDGFAFAESGTLSVVNVPADGSNLKTASFTPFNCTGVENLSNWTLLVDGEEDTKYTVKVSSDGMVRLISPAMRVIVR